MGLAAVRSVGSARSARGAVDPDDFEQELIDQYSLALSAVGITDRQRGLPLRLSYTRAGGKI